MSAGDYELFVKKVADSNNILLLVQVNLSVIFDLFVYSLRIS